MIGKTILRYKIIEKLGSPREIIVIKFHNKWNSGSVISQGKGGNDDR